MRLGRDRFAVERDEIVLADDEPIDDRRAHHRDHAKAQEKTRREEMRPERRLEHRGDKEEQQKSGEAPFADQSESDNEPKQEIVLCAPVLSNPHEGPEARRDEARQHHRVGHALMQVPRELIEQEWRQPREDGEAPLAEYPRGREIEKGDRAREQSVFDEEEARERRPGQLLHRPEQPLIEWRLPRHIAESQCLGEDVRGDVVLREVVGEGKLSKPVREPDADHDHEAKAP